VAKGKAISSWSLENFNHSVFLQDILYPPHVCWIVVMRKNPEGMDLALVLLVKK
jgi:hypothetical protein